MPADGRRILRSIEHMLSAAAFNLAIAFGEADLNVVSTGAAIGSGSDTGAKPTAVFTRFGKRFQRSQRIGDMRRREFGRDFGDRLEGEAFLVIMRGIETAFRQRSRRLSYTAPDHT